MHDRDQVVQDDVGLYHTRLPVVVASGDIQPFVAVVNGKYDFIAKAISGDFYAIGSVTKLLKAYEALIK